MEREATRARARPGIVEVATRVSDDKSFQIFILAVIVINAVMVGLETWPELMATYGWVLKVLNWVIQGVFVVEIVIRMVAFWPRLHRFFHDGWNVFDFLIVFAATIPMSGSYATVARVARLMRVTRLISVAPNLRLLVGTMYRSVSSIAHVLMLLSLVIYVYASLGYHFFGARDPENWGTLGSSVLTLFQILTLEGWAEIQKLELGTASLAWLFFGTYIILAVFVVLNLFIAIIINNLEQVRHEQIIHEDEQNRHRDILQRIESLKLELERLEEVLRKPPK